MSAGCCCHWGILLVDLLLAALLSCLSGSLYAVHRVSSRSDTLPAHRMWWVPSKLPMLTLLFPMPRQHWRIAREDDDIQTDRGLVEGRLSALEVWWGRKPISITCSINSNYGSLCCSYLPLCLISRYKLLHLEWINNVVLQYSTGNYIQFPGISHNGKKRNIKKNLYIYNWVTLLYSRNWHNIANQLYFNKNMLTNLPNNHNVVTSMKTHSSLLFHTMLSWLLY